jgi:prepilin-type processing-associated H-X9-DG protein
MYCKKCGVENSEEAKVCSSCGFLLRVEQPPKRVRETRICGLAVASFVLGVLAIFTLGLTAIPSVITGIVSLVKIEKSGGKLRGKEFAVAGIVVPVLALIPLLGYSILGRIKQLQKETLCHRQLQEWGLVWAMYTADNRGVFPEGGNWPETSKRYYARDDRLLFCPTATKSRQEGGKIPFAAWQVGSTKGSYGLNLWVTQNAQGRRSEERLWRTPSVKGSGYVPVFFDCLSPGISPLQTDKPPEYKNQPRDTADDQNEIRDCCIDRHLGRTPVLFMDWHVERVGLRGLWKLRWHRQWDQSTEPEWPKWMLKAKYRPDASVATWTE